MDSNKVPRSNQETLEQLVSVLQVLRIGVESYRTGHVSAWMIVSAFLHQLLVDTARKATPLLLRVIPSATLHPLRQDYSKTVVDYLIAYGAVRVGKSTRGADLFDFDSRCIPVEEWLNQVPLVQRHSGNSFRVSIRDLINSTRNQGGGGHFDHVVAPITYALEKGTVKRDGKRQTTLAYDYVVAIGDYIQQRVNTDLMGAIGNGYLIQGRMDEARKFIETAVQESRKVGDLQGICDQLQNLGYLLAHLQEWEGATRCYEEAQKLSEQINYPEASVVIQRNLTFIKNQR